MASRTSGRPSSQETPNTMAVVSGYQNSRWKNSVGNVTFRAVKGRTIASEKVASRPLTQTKGTTGKLMSQRQMTFGLINRFSKTHESDINQSFNTTKYGTARNYFMKVNYNALFNAFAPLYSQIDDSAVDTMAITDTAIEDAITDYATEHPTAIYRVRKAGLEVVYLDGAWDSSANPITATVRLGGTTIQNGGDTRELTTGETLRIEGTGLTEGAITLGMATTADGSPTDVAIATALTGSNVTETLVTGNIASAYDGQYLVNIKVGDSAILSLTNVADEGGEGSFG